MMLPDTAVRVTGMQRHKLYCMLLNSSLIPLARMNVYELLYSIQSEN